MLGLKRSIWIVLIILLTGQLFAADRIAVIQYPVTTRPALVVKGGTFTIECKASSNTTGWDAELFTPFFHAGLDVSAAYNSTSGLWELTAQVPQSTPFELYDLKVTASGLEDETVHSVRVLSEFRDTYYFIHVPDMHIPSVYWIGAYDDDNTVPELLKVFGQLAIINPEFVLQTGDFVDNGKLAEQYEQAQQLLYTSQVPMFLTGGNHDLWYDGHDNWKKYFNPVMNYSFNYGSHHYTGLEMYDTPTVTFTADQMSWLQNDLEQSRNRGDQMRSLFYHYDQSSQIDDDFVDEYEVDLIVYGHTHVDNVGSKGSRGAPNLNTSYTMDNRGTYRLVKVSNNRVQSWPLLSMSKLNIDYSPANDGSNWQVTATITNSNNVEFENGLIKFYVQHNSAGYSVTGGETAQVVTTTDTDIYYVTVDIAANSVQKVDIISNAPSSNRPPRISSYTPTTDVVVMAGQEKQCKVVASDPDNQSLTYKWYINDVLVTGTSATYNYKAERWYKGLATLRAKVSDGTFYDEHTWNIEVREYSDKPELLFPSMSFLLENEEAELQWEEAFDHPLDIRFEYGLEPGVYTGSIPENGNNSVFFVPEEEDMGLGVHYCRLTDGEVSSDPFTLIIESPVAPQMQYPIGNVADLSPVFSWDRVPGVPYYVVICSDEEIIINEDPDTGEITVEGANPIWSLITSENSVNYGAPDPSGTYTSAPAPLIPGKSYWWVVLNCYGNVPELTSSVQSGISKFTVDLEPPSLGTPVLTYPQDNAELDDETISFTWEPVEGAKAYHFYPFKIEEEFGIESARSIWQTTITTTEERYDYPASELLMKGNYRWKVAAVAANGMEVMSDAHDFTYDAPAAELSIYTYYNQIVDGNTVNKPLPRVTINYETIDGIYSDMPLSTDLDGRRLNFNIAPGTYRLTLSKEGYDTQIDTLVLQADQHYNKSFWLNATSSAISGRVVDNSATPMTDATVTAQHNLHAEIVSTTFTDAQGNFRLSVVPGPYLVWANKANYQISDTLALSVNDGDEADLDQDLVIARNANRITGKVVNTQQQPVFGVTVTLTDGENFSCVTDANGQYSFSVPDGTWELIAAKQGFISSEPRTLTTSGGATIQVTPALVLQANAGIIQGRVKDGSRQLSDVLVRAFPLTGDSYETTTDDYGQFTLNVTGGSYTLTVEKSGYIAQGEIQTSVQAGGTQSGIEISMVQALSTINGKVTTDGYTPLAGVKVYNSNKSVITTEGGHYELQVEDGIHIIAAQKEGYISSHPDTINVASSQQVEGVNFVLSPNASVIKGQITSNGSPVYNAKVKASGASTIESFSDESGRYVLNLPSGIWDIAVTKTGFIQVTESELTIGVGQTLANKNYILVPGSATLKGTVISKITGETLKNVLVAVEGSEIATHTATDGTFSLTVDPGNYDVSAAKTGFRQITKNTGDVAMNRTKQMEFQLEPVESSFKGLVTNQASDPLAGVTVRAKTALDSFVTTTKTDGTFRLDVNSGTYTVTATKTGYKTASWGNQVRINANEVVTLESRGMGLDRGTLTGVVQRVVNNEPVASAKIMAKGQCGFSLQTQSGSTGEFSFVDDQNVPLLIPDMYDLIVSKSGFTPDTLFDIQLDTDQSKRVEAHILKNEGVITGKITSGGTSLVDATVSAKFSSTGELYNAISKTDGTFNIKSVPVGNYTLSAAKVGYSSPDAMGVSTGNSYDIELVQNTGRISGQVHDSESQAGIAGVAVAAADGKGNFASAETNAQGEFSMQQLSMVNDYTLQFSRSGYRDATLGAVSAQGKSSVNVNMIKIQGNISGHVTDTDGNIMSGVMITATGSGTTRVETTNTNGDYSFAKLGAAQYTITAAKVGYAGDPVQQIVLMWQGGDTTGVDFVMQEARAAELKIIGPDLVSNTAQGEFGYSAKTDDQREASIEPVWSVEQSGAVETLNGDVVLDPVNDFVGQVTLKLSDRYSGLAVSKTLSITQELTPKNPDLTLSNKKGVELFIQDSCVTQNAVLQLRRPSLAESMKKDKHYSLVGEVYELSPAQYKFTKPATLALPVPDSKDPAALQVCRWNMDKLEWEAVEGATVSTGRISIPVSKLGRYAIMESSQPLGIHDIRFDPNPFSPLFAPLKIHFTLTSDQTTAPVVTIKIYNMVGDLVRTLANGELMATGENAPVEWDGITDYGKMAMNGRYLIHFKIKDSSGEKEELKTFVLIK